MVGFTIQTTGLCNPQKRRIIYQPSYRCFALYGFPNQYRQKVAVRKNTRTDLIFHVGENFRTAAYMRGLLRNFLSKTSYG
jgi:hypothetical protein